MELLPFSRAQSPDAVIIGGYGEQSRDHVAEARYCERRVDAVAFQVAEKQDERYQVEGVRGRKPQSYLSSVSHQTSGLRVIYNGF